MCTTEEVRIVEDFLNSFQKNNEWNESIHGRHSEVENRIFEKLEQKLKPKANKSTSRKLITTSSLLVAASLSILLVLSILMYSSDQDVLEKSKVSTVIRKAEKGQKYSIVLADGTKVRLNSESTLIFPEKFANDTREVELIGEAFFEVTKNPKKPFIVKTKKLTTEVLGTSFNIQAFEKKKSSVTVVTGKVKVSVNQYEKLAKESILLLPKEQGYIDLVSNELTKTNVELDKVISWKDNTILFDHVSMREAADILERWYDVTITFDKSNLKECLILRSSYKNESLENILKSLKFIQGIDFRFVNSKEVVISGGICKN
ncbi:FecR family protein [Reichenbachiella sp. MALMAid0571]|uniref:FecR family protein n=1 Tax=Reichenbachiella sp. MALMAid0571 TaxID=3143939 RepID=UPI0032DFA4C9